MKTTPSHDYQRVYVWEQPVRWFHWINAAAIVVLGVSGFLIAHPPAFVTSTEASAGYWFGARSTEPREPSKPVKLAVFPPSGFALEGAASRQSFALSPDGTHLAFTAMDSTGAFSAFVRDLNSLEPRLIPGSEGAHTLFWPRDGQSLYLTAKGKLWRTPLEDDARVLLADSPPFLFSGAWLSPTRILLDSFRASYLVSPSGGSLDKLKEIYLWPQRLPDGEHLLYIAWDADAGRHRARVLRLSDLLSR